jgi:DNA-binding NarL/FixJ family response regulator
MNKFNALTDLQIEVWKAVSEGQSSIEIAEQRGISEKAVEAIISRIYTFLEIKKTKSINPRVVLANSFNKLAGKLR